MCKMDVKEIKLGTTLISDKNGNQFKCTFKIHSPAYIPDVYVNFTHNIGRLELYDDDTFVDNCIKFLRTLGYNGDDFGRAELGMQGDDYIALEPTNNFCGFVMKKFKWKYADKNTKSQHYQKVIYERNKYTA